MIQQSQQTQVQVPPQWQPYADKQNGQSSAPASPWQTSGQSNWQNNYGLKPDWGKQQQSQVTWPSDRTTYNAYAGNRYAKPGEEGKASNCWKPDATTTKNQVSIHIRPEGSIQPEPQEQPVTATPSN
eukprot:5828938-Amphidinium_carterae.1